MRPTMASIPDIGKVQKVSKIYKSALFCIYLNSLREYDSGILL